LLPSAVIDAALATVSKRIIAPIEFCPPEPAPLGEPSRWSAPTGLRAAEPLVEEGGSIAGSAPVTRARPRRGGVGTPTFRAV